MDNLNHLSFPFRQLIKASLYTWEIFYPNINFFNFELIHKKVTYSDLRGGFAFLERKKGTEQGYE